VTENQPEPTPVDLKVDYRVYDEENNRVLEINMAMGTTEVNLIVDAPVKTEELAILIGSMPQVVRSVLGHLDPKELA